MIKCNRCKCVDDTVVSIKDDLNLCEVCIVEGFNELLNACQLILDYPWGGDGDPDKLDLDVYAAVMMATGK